MGRTKNTLPTDHTVRDQPINQSAAHFATSRIRHRYTPRKGTHHEWEIEEHFHDVKEIWGAGQQQVRNIWSNIGCWHLNQWMYTLVEVSSWDVSKPMLTDRSNRPWDNPDRRPSHADRRSTIAREMLRKQFLATLPRTLNLRKFRTLINDVISLST